jgi:hypothetical protein
MYYCVLTSVVENKEFYSILRKGMQKLKTSLNAFLIGLTGQNLLLIKNYRYVVNLYILSYFVKIEITSFLRSGKNESGSPIPGGQKRAGSQIRIRNTVRDIPVPVLESYSILLFFVCFVFTGAVRSNFFFITKLLKKILTTNNFSNFIFQNV